MKQILFFLLFCCASLFASFSRSHEMFWGQDDGELAFSTHDGKYAFSITLDDDQFNKLPEHCRNKFLWNGEKHIFAYQSPNYIAPKLPESQGEIEYTLTERRIFKEASPRKDIDIDQLAELIKTKKVAFYTGAGISTAAGVPLMHQLSWLFDFEHSWIPKALHNPEKILSKISFFFRQCFEAHPTPAHFKLTEIAKSCSATIFTENLDHLHQKTGLDPFVVSAEEVKKQINPQEIDAIICIGLSYDDKGFLNWYKKHQPNGQIISIDLRKPSYLGDEDYFLEGNLHLILPMLSEKVL